MERISFRRWLRFIPLVGGILFLVVQCTVSGESSSGEESRDTTETNAETITFAQLAQAPYADLHLTRLEYKGKVIYDHYCAVCHGENGDGNGFNAFNLESSFQVKPFDFTDSTAMAGLSEEEMKQAIRYGGTAVGKSPYMPPWGYTLREDEIRALIAYLRTFPALSKEE